MSDLASFSLPLHFFSLFKLQDSPSSSIPSSSSFSSLTSALLGPASSSIPTNSALDNNDNEIETVLSDLHDDYEKQLKLKKFILNKTSKNTMYDSASITLLPTLVIKNKVLPSTTCFWTILKDKEGKRYALCLINISEVNGFNLFRFDLEKFSKRFEIEFLQKDVETSQELKLKSMENYLKNWYDHSVDYLTRSILLMSEDLDVLIHACLMGHKIHIQGSSASNSSLYEDISRLVESFQLHSYSSESDSTKTGQEKTELDDHFVSIQLFDPSSRPVIDTNETNEFCREWAFRLVHQSSNKESSDALMLRSWIEHVKLQITQELNHIRKLCDAAIIDNYALFEAFIYLKNNPNQDVLLVLLLKEQTSSDPQLKQVLHVIFKCLTENHSILNKSQTNKNADELESAMEANTRFDAKQDANNMSKQEIMSP